MLAQPLYSRNITSSSRRREEMGPATGARRLLTAGLVLLLLGLVPTPAAAGARRCRSLRATIVGSPGADQIIGTPRRDIIAARGGADIIRGRGGNDEICGGGGPDRVHGGGGGDQLAGGPGPDRLNGAGGIY